MILNKTSKYINSKYRDLQNYISDVDTDLNNIFLALNGRLRFGAGTAGQDGENFAGQWASVANTGTANTEFTVAHTAGYVPTGFLVIRNNTGGVIYDSGTTWTSTNIYLKSSVANAAITLFLI